MEGKLDQNQVKPLSVTPSKQSHNDFCGSRFKMFGFMLTIAKCQNELVSAI